MLPDPAPLNIHRARGSVSPGSLFGRKTYLTGGGTLRAAKGAIDLPTRPQRRGVASRPPAASVWPSALSERSYMYAPALSKLRVTFPASATKRTGTPPAATANDAS